MENQQNYNSIELPILPLRGLTIFPGVLMTFDVERPMSLEALNRAMSRDHLIFLSTQKDISIDVPDENDIYPVGTVCRIRQMIRIPNSRMCRVLAEGMYRGEILKFSSDKSCMTTIVCEMPDKKERVSTARAEALVRNVQELFDEYLRLSQEMPAEQMLNILGSTDLSHIAYYIAQNIRLDTAAKQKLLEECHPSRRLSLLSEMLNHELDIISIEKELSEAAQQEMTEAQREYLLREQMKIIQEELGEIDTVDDIAEYRAKIGKLEVSKEIKDRLLKEVSKLVKQPFGSSEASVIRTYLDTCLEVPWNKFTADTSNIQEARNILDADHYGLQKVKERILEYLAVKALKPDLKGGLICLVGPPGTGKTSIAMSVAKATGRNLVRVSLGGVHDEAEIRGHRKTYVGAMPGRIVTGIIQAGSMNPLMVLDEIDKLGSDYRGDPSAALLEAMDPEQNCTFRDNFMEIPMDLSNVFFITTANSLDTIPRPLLDRMEIIELSSYTDEEKVQIAKKYLVPKQREKHGLSGKQLRFKDSVIRSLISDYTRESGVRTLERNIASVCRKAAAGIAEQKYSCFTVKEADLLSMLGPKRFKPENVIGKDSVGLVHGLAYTSVGGEMLDVEVAVVDGSGKLELTGNLGDVMKESARAALTFIRSRAKELGIDSEFYKNKDIHVHYPEGAVPKDGPSAGITTCVALVSALTGIPARHDVAMTGEITLRGRVTAIGGLREKTMGALRAGIKTVLIPLENKMDLEEIDPLVREKLEFIFVNDAMQALTFALNGSFTGMGCEKITSVHKSSNPELNSVC